MATPDTATNPLWRQFRRLLLGSVVECLLDAGVAVDFATIHIEFTDDSVFRVPRLDNYMRFVGSVTATPTAPPPAHRLARLQELLEECWPELLSTLDIPIGDRLTADNTHIRATVSGGRLTVQFDLSAD